MWAYIQYMRDLFLSAHKSYPIAQWAVAHLDAPNDKIILEVKVGRGSIKKNLNKKNLNNLFLIYSCNI